MFEKGDILIVKKNKRNKINSSFDPKNIIVIFDKLHKDGDSFICNFIIGNISGYETNNLSLLFKGWPTSVFKKANKIEIFKRLNYLSSLNLPKEKLIFKNF